MKETPNDQKESKKKWFVFWTFSGKEKKVKRLVEEIVRQENLKDKVGRILIPTRTVPKLRGGKRKIEEKPLFRGYILIEMEPDPELISKLTSFRTLRALIAHDTLITLSQEEVDRILETVEKEKEKKAKEIPFLKGETVRVIDGPFADFTGKVEEIYPERGKLKVLVNIFGRTTPVVLDFLQVERV